MDKVVEYILIIALGSATWYSLSTVIYIVGLWRMLGKSGIKPFWALVPFARDYMLAKCAGNEKAGRAIFVLDVLLTLSAIADESIEIANFSLPAAAVILALIIMRVIFSIRVYRDLVDIYEVSRKWLLLWIPFSGIASLIFGFSKKLNPSVQADLIIRDISKAEEETTSSHTWGGDFKSSMRRLFGYFAFKGDWKCLPIAVAITAIVAYIARTDFFVSMEGTIKGSLALTCIAIWNGCFTSIPVICRERGRIRRLCREGMHISSYIVSVLLYQLILCLAQTVLTMYTCRLLGISFPHEGLFVTSLLFEIGITVFLITFAADMVSLFISSLVTDSVVAMTIMPFVLVIQLVFSGSVINLQSWSRSITKYTISNYGVKCIAAQADDNNRPMPLAWTTLMAVQDTKVGSEINLGDVMDRLQDEEHSPAVKQMRATTIGRSFTIGEIRNILYSNNTFNQLLDKDLEIDVSIGEIIDLINDEKTFPAISEIKKKDISKVFTVGELGDIINSTSAMKTLRDKTILFGIVTVGDALDLVLSILEDVDFKVTVNVGEVLDKILASDDVVAMRDKRPFEGLTLRKILELSSLDKLMDKYSDVTIGAGVPVGQLIDQILAMDAVKNLRDVNLDLSFTLGELIDMLGREQVKAFVIERTSAAIMVPEYVHLRENVAHYWAMIGLFILIFMTMSVAAVAIDVQIAKKKLQP